VADPAHRQAAGRLRELLAAYERNRDLVALGAYQPGADPVTDEAIARLASINDFLRQRTDEQTSLEQTREHLVRLVAGGT